MRFYAYRAYRNTHRTAVTHDLDTTTGAPPRPAGDVLIFSSKRQRDDYVAQGFEEALLANDVQYHALSAIDAKTARKLYPCYDNGRNSCVELKSCAAHGRLKSELDAEEAYFKI